MIETKFKQTEIGLIPDDWKVESIRDHYLVGSSKRVFQHQWRIEGIPFYRARDIVALNNNTFCCELYIDRELYETYKAKYGIPKRGDVLVTGVGTLGVVYVINDDSPFYYKDGNIICLSTKGTFNSFFLSYLFKSPILLNQINDNSGGSTVGTYTIRNAESTKIIVPPISEQQRIAEALLNIDNLISSLLKMIEKKRLIKQGAMQQLLTGKKRLPGFDGEWENRELGLIANIQRGTILKSSEYLFGTIPVIAGGTTPAGFHNVANRKGRTITISASGANAGYISYYKEPIFATDCSTISESNDYFIDFIYYALLIKQNEIFLLQTGGAQPHIHPKDIAPLKIAIPCVYEEQVAIANILTTMDNEIESLEDERDKYVHLKEGMMQKLLTGQIRLIQAETKKTALPKPKVANVYFKRSVLAAEIADRLCEEKTFGHVKMEKLIFLTEHLCHIDIDSHYHRDAAGPYDNTALRSIDTQMRKQRWFELTKNDKGYRYQPMNKRGEHKKYFDKYYSDVLPMFNKVIETFKTSTTEQCEIVATLYSAWDDLMHSGQAFTDNDILNEVLNNWHESKKRIKRSRWQAALDWMRSNDFEPQNENN